MNKKTNATVSIDGGHFTTMVYHKPLFTKSGLNQVTFTINNFKNKSISVLIQSVMSFAQANVQIFNMKLIII